jgi:hypothetical protein
MRFSFIFPCDICSGYPLDAMGKNAKKKSEDLKK